jgi:5-formyltetrahydrofolate cyclo-ligase
MEAEDQKNKLRNWAKGQRLSLSQQEVSDQSVAIANRLLTLPIWNRQNYHLFMTIESQKEVDTEPILTLLQGKDKRVILPRSHTDGTLSHYLLDEQTLLIKNRWGIPEPESGIQVKPDQLDVVFVPLLVADLSGNRIGYGKGYYDRFISELNPNALTIGLSLLDPVTKIEAVEAHDRALDLLVTPHGHYYFNSEKLAC